MRRALKSWEKDGAGSSVGRREAQRAVLLKDFVEARQTDLGWGRGSEDQGREWQESLGQHGVRIGLAVKSWPRRE